MLLSRGRQQQKGGVIVKARLTRWSYGIVWNQLFNPHIHRDQELFRDETDGQVYARNQIRWFVGKVRFVITSTCPRLESFPLTPFLLSTSTLTS